MSTITPNLTAGMSRSTAISRMREMARAKVGNTAANALTTLGALREVLNVDAPPEYSIYNYEPGSTARAKVNAYHNSVSRISMLNYIFDQSIGLFIDPSDSSTLFQDSAGTTPVTTPGQLVGLALDKSRGLVLGPELISNDGPFINTTGWTVPLGTLAVVGSNLVLTCATNGRTVAPVLAGLVIGKTYQISINGVEGSAAVKTARITTGSDGVTGQIFSHVISGVSISCVFVASATTHYLALVANGSAGQTFSISSASVKELPGNHAAQTTSGSRPTYGIHPLSGRRNLSTYSEQFDNAAWAKLNVSFLANADIAPDGTNTAYKFLDDTVSGSHQFSFNHVPTASTAYAMSFYAKASELSTFSIVTTGAGMTTRSSVFDLSAGTMTGFGAIQSVGNGWYRCTQTFTTVTADGLTARFRFRKGGTDAYSGIGEGLYVWGAQLETGSTATAYQKVTTQYNVTEAGVTSVGYLAFDGSNDFLVTPSIDFPSYGRTGTELVYNGDFSLSSGWTLGSGWSISGGVASFSAGTDNSDIAQSIGLPVIGKTYRVSITQTWTSGNTIRAIYAGSYFDIPPVSGTYSFDLLAISSPEPNIRFRSILGTTVASIDNISVKEAIYPADKMTVFAGVRKLSDAATGTLIDFGNIGIGSFTIRAPSAALNGYQFFSVGTLSANPLISGFAAPTSDVITGIGNISGDSAILRVDGTQVAQSTTDQSGGNYGNYPLYIGMRAGTSLPFNGYLYNLIVVNKPLTSDQTYAIENYVNSKTGAY